MPSAITHAIVGLGLAEMFHSSDRSVGFYGLSMALAAGPDLDVLAFWFGIPYGSFFGHRGFFHSLFFAGLVGLGVALATLGSCSFSWWQLWLYFFGVLASHGILDCFTNGGMGIALFSPFDTTRYFFTWTPIEVAPIGLAFFGPWGVRVMRSEIIWVWLPLGIIMGGVFLVRSFS
jgi:inner membrane protein